MRIPNAIDSFLKRPHARLDPARDWLTMLTLSMIVFAGIIVWNAWAFDTVASGGVIGAPVTGSTPVLSRSALDAIHAIFAARAAEEAKYQTDVYTYTDPSQ